MFIVGLLYSVLLYELPFFLTLAKTGWLSVPPTFNADQNLYLNLTQIHHVSPTQIVNPWYGDLVPVVDVPHLMFGIAFHAFHLVHGMFGSYTAAMLVWTAVWTTLTFSAATFCLESFFPEIDRLWIVAGACGLLVLQSPLVYLEQLRHLPRFEELVQLHLPYSRFIVPQVVLPAITAYWGLQVRALKSASYLSLAGMAFLQLAVSATYPYMLPVIAIGTGITVLIAKYRQKDIALSWSAILVFAGVCGILDAGYLLLAGFGKSQGNVHFAFQFRPEVILPALRPYVVALIVVAGFALYSRASPATRITAAGFALSNALFAFSDVIFRPEAQMLDHPLYIVGITTWLPLFVLLSSFLMKFDSRSLRIALVSGLAFIGAWEGYATYRTWIPIDQFQATALHEVEKLCLTSNDLVIAPGRFTDDVSSWIPLVSPARVLYTIDGENILSAAETKTDHTFRQALYLMMAGMNSSSLIATTEHGSADRQFWPLLQHNDRTYFKSALEQDHALVRRVVRERFIPVFARLESDPESVRAVLGDYPRIIVIDSSASPLFQQSAFSKWLEVDRDYVQNGIKISLCHWRLAFGATLTTQSSDRQIR